MLVMSISSTTVFFKWTLSRWAYHLSTLEKNQGQKVTSFYTKYDYVSPPFPFPSFRYWRPSPERVELSFWHINYTLTPLKMFSCFPAKFALSVKGWSSWFPWVSNFNCRLECMWRHCSNSADTSENGMCNNWTPFSFLALALTILHFYLNLTTILEAAKWIHI